MGLGFESRLNAELEGSGYLSNFKSSSRINFLGSHVEHTPVGNSFLHLSSTGKKLDIKGAMFADQINIASTLNLDKSNRELSSLKVRLDMDNVKNILGPIEKKNMEDPYLKGSISGSIQSTFDLYRPERLNLDVVLDYLNLQRRGTNLRTIGKGNKVNIKNGTIKEWSVMLRGDSDYIVSKGRGKIHESFRVDSEFSFNASVLEVLSSKYVIPEGNVHGRYLLLGEGLNFSSFLESSGENIKLKIEKVPGVFSAIKFHTIAEGTNVQISSVSAEYGNGTVKGNGTIRLGLKYPEVDLKYEVDKTFIKVFKKSGFLLSSIGTVQGNRRDVSP